MLAALLLAATLAVDVPMAFDDHVPAIDVMINGKGPFRFEVDTGFGGAISLGPALAKEFGSHIESLAIGALHLGPLVVVQRRANIISLNLFRGFLVTFDYPNSRFRARRGSLPVDAMTYTTEHGVPAIDIDVAGQKFKVDIDSGSPGELTLPLRAAKSLPLASEPVLVGRGRTNGAPFEIYAAPLKGDARIGAITLTNPRIDFISAFPVGNLGSRFLRNLVVTFDPKSRSVVFTRS